MLLPCVSNNSFLGLCHAAVAAKVGAAVKEDCDFNKDGWAIPEQERSRAKGVVCVLSVVPLQVEVFLSHSMGWLGRCSVRLR